MSHDPPSGQPHVIFDDGCQECLERVKKGVHGLFQLDTFNMRRLGLLTAQVLIKGTRAREELGASHADMRAVDTVIDARRLVRETGVSLT